MGRKTAKPAGSPQPAPTYEQLRTELDQLLQALQQDDLDVDTALRHYRRGLELVQALQAYLKTAETTLTELKARAEPPA